jgi:subtilisin-like proprotein convertase family protein
LGVSCLWLLANKRGVDNVVSPPIAETAAVKKSAAGAENPIDINSLRLLSAPVNLATLSQQSAETTAAQATNRHPYRLSNTGEKPGALARNDKAILLENALLDTSKGTKLAIPDDLRAHGDPGSYIVQSRRPPDDAFRQLLRAAGASVVSYIPNNAYLVRTPASVADALGMSPQVQAVLPYEPYFKLKGSLLKVAVESNPNNVTPSSAGQTTPSPYQLQPGEPLMLNLLLFPQMQDEAMLQLQALGAQVVATDRSPFGPVLKVRTQAGDLPSLAALTAVQEMELAHVRQPANDLSRVRTGIATDPTSPTNYLGLTGSNVVVNVNDSGVDTNHPDLMGRVTYDFPFSGMDSNGHGTFVAGTIASSGGQSSTVTNASSLFGPYAGTNTQFRGIATNATIFSLLADPLFGPTYSDAYLQETVARSNIFISNNSWNYTDLAQFKFDVASYDLAAASYDAAVRDALPMVPGSQPMLFVFSAGDSGNGNQNGTGGLSDTIQSPATAKNVITVGGVEQDRNITNQVAIDVANNLSNAVWQFSTDSTNQVASFSSRGNAGVGIEGDFGRFKPDLVAPSTFLISTRSGQWDENSYYSQHEHLTGPELFLPPRSLFAALFDLPANPTGVNIRLVKRESPSPQDPVSPALFPDLPIFVSSSHQPLPAFDFKGTNSLTIPNPTPTGTNWLLTVVNTSTQMVVFGVVVDLMSVDTNDMTLPGLSNLNDTIGPFYRYESGTSIAAAQVSGALALMQEFLTAHGRTNGWGGPDGRSPALMKAMLINGARPIGNNYNLQVQTVENFQGWGVLSLPSTLQGGLANEAPLGTAGATNSMWLVDQDPTNALATGQSHTYKISVDPAAADSYLRVTLAWTDPPGNPVAGIKLVNDLDLVVTNVDTAGTGLDQVFFGNDILDGKEVTLPWDTNGPPNIDVVNNVENIIIPPPLFTNYTITVSGHRVNVNADSLNPNNVVQDYALVVSCGDGQLLTNAITLSSPTPNSVATPQFTPMVNDFVGSPDYFGQTVQHQRAGANSPLLGTNNFILASQADAQVTIGVTNQWHFYVITNETTFTNARFVIANPLELAVPRMGTRVLIDTNATRVEPDLDMYVSTDPSLLLLDPAVLSSPGTFRRLGREGTANLVISNAQQVAYYIGIKAEDQMAAEYTFQALFSRLPFGENNSFGNLTYWLAPAVIPDGTPPRPGITNLLIGPGDPTILVRRVIVSNLLSHQLMSDLVGTLRYSDGTFAILNNHGPDTMVLNKWYIYDDSNENNIFGARHTTGPGTLASFAGRHLGDMFTFSMSDDQFSHIGTNRLVYVFMEKQQPLDQGIIINLAPGGCSDQFQEVPPQATAMTVSANILSGTGPVTLQVCENPDGPCTPTNNVGSGVIVTLDQFSDPPLRPGVYKITVCNHGTDAAQVFLKVTLDFSFNPIQSVSYRTNPIAPIADDAVTYSAFFVSNHAQIVSLDVGLLITNHTRASDLAITLISPTGKRILLSEGRGAYETNGVGTFNIGSSGLVAPGFSYTNLAPFYTNDFDGVPVGSYTPGAVFDGWSVLSNWVNIFPELPAPWLSNNVLVVGYGAVSNAFPTVPFTGFRTNLDFSPVTNIYALTFNVTHAPYLVGTVGWWPFDNQSTDPTAATTPDIFGGFTGLADAGGERRGAYAMWRPGLVNGAFWGDGQAARVMVPRAPALDVGQRGGFSIEGWINPASSLVITGLTVISNSFEGIPDLPILYSAGTYLDGWLVESGNVDSPYPGYGFLPPATADTGRHVMDLNGVEPGSVSTNFATTVGQTYLLTFAYTKDPSSAAPGYPNHVSSAQIFITGQGPIPLSYGAPNDYTNLNWAHAAFRFTASSAMTKLTFAGTGSGDFGVFIDTVQVREVNIAPPTAPLAEWDDVTPTNVLGGVQFWYSGLPGSATLPGSLWANIRDTNFNAHVIGMTTGVLTNNGWQHVALTYDAGTMLAKLYTNGQLAAAQVLPGPNFTPRTSGDLYFGWSPAAASASPLATTPLTPGFHGGLDEFGLYERPLSGDEVFAIFNAGAAGKYGTNVLWCPLTNSVTGASLSFQVQTALGNVTVPFTNGIAWPTNGLAWETNILVFTNAVLYDTNSGLVTNLTGLVLANGDPNLTLDNFVLSVVKTNALEGLMHFTDDGALATNPIKFATTPYILSNAPPTLIFVNGFEAATNLQRVYTNTATIPGSSNAPAIGQRDWTVLSSSVTVLSNSLVDARATNCVALANGGLQCLLPTSPQKRYRLTYTFRGPGAVSWWNGATEPYSQRAWDLLGGNHGAFFFNTTNAYPGYVGPTALYFNGPEEPTPDRDFFYNDNDDPASKLELGDPPNLRLTNAFTIEGWFRPTAQTNPAYCGTEMLLFRGYPDIWDCGGCRDPYWLALEPFDNAPGNSRWDIRFHISDGQPGTCGADAVTTNFPVLLPGWWHIAAVFDEPFTNVTYTVGTNTYTFVTNQMRIYLNGSLVASNYTTLTPFRDLDPAYSPGVTIGNRSRYDFTQPYRGFMDELTVYGRALSEPELTAFVARRQAGKADLTARPSQSLAKLNVTLDGVQRDLANAENGEWTTRTIDFTAFNTNIVLTMASLEPGTILDGITLWEMPDDLTYLPEETLSVVDGEDTYGTWLLEIWDMRAGPTPVGTNDLARLVSWRLDFQLLPTPQPPIIQLTHGITYTNNLVPGGVQYFVVNVPQWATMATNVLLSTYQYRTTNPSTVGVLFDTNGFPLAVTNGLLWPPVFSGVTNLMTNSTPYFITNGAPYYLAVTNPNPVSVTFALGVWFDINPLTNCQPASNFVWQAGIPRYFQFDVPTNVVPPGLAPYEVSFYLAGVTNNYTGYRSNLTVVLSQQLPLPDLTHYDYLSRLPATNNDAIVVLTNSTPFYIQTNRWYVGVFSDAPTNVPFMVQACYTTGTNYPVIIPLTNGVPFAIGEGTNQFAAPPGPPEWFFFQFTITNSVSRILFELYNLSGDADLVLQREALPGTAPYFAGSYRTGRDPEQIVLIAGRDSPDLLGNWYLGIINNEATNLTYTLRAVVRSGGLLLSAQPTVMSLTPMAPPHGTLLQWNSVIGEPYFVQYRPTVFGPPSWTNVALVTATTPLTTYEANVPGFYRVSQTSALNLPGATLTILPWPGNLLRLSWSTNYPGETLQFSTVSPNGPWQNVQSPPATPVTIIGPEYVVFDPMVAVPKYYRLIP